MKKNIVKAGSMEHGFYCTVTYTFEKATEKEINSLFMQLDEFLRELHHSKVGVSYIFRREAFKIKVNTAVSVIIAYKNEHRGGGVYINEESEKSWIEEMIKDADKLIQHFDNIFASID
jgi:hypothetical protein